MTPNFVPLLKQPTKGLVAAVEKFYETEGEAVLAWLRVRQGQGDAIRSSSLPTDPDLLLEELNEMFGESYRGTWSDEEDFAQNRLISMGLGWYGVSSSDIAQLEPYLDWEAISDELFRSDYAFEDGYVFELGM